MFSSLFERAPNTLSMAEHAPVLLPQEMMLWDSAAQRDYGISSALLMEHAGREAFHVLLTCLADRIKMSATVLNAYSTSDNAEALLGGLRILCVAGSGNNGGDAMVLARHLHSAHANIILLLTKAQKAYKGAPAEALRLARKCGVPVLTLRPQDTANNGFSAPFTKRIQALFAHQEETTALVEKRNENAYSGEKANKNSPHATPFPTLPPLAHIIVDGVLGTGLQGHLRPQSAALLSAINSCRNTAFLFSLDIPSGMNGESGECAPETICAHATVCFEAAKFGQMQASSLPLCGKLFIRNISMPRAVREHYPARISMPTPRIAARLPKAQHSMHKGTAGHVLIFGGSLGMSGAARLAALAALRGGAGLVTIACPAPLVPEISAAFPDCMTLPLPLDAEWNIAGSGAEEFTEEFFSATNENTHNAAPSAPHNALYGSQIDTGMPLPELEAAHTALAAMQSNLPAERTTALAHNVPVHNVPIVTTPYNAYENLFHLTRLQELLQKSSALVVGCGMGRTAGALFFLRALLAQKRPPSVIDADALFLLARYGRIALDGQKPLFDLLTNTDVLTPHPKEAATLLQCTTQEVQKNRLFALQKLCAASPAVCVLKGAGSLIGQQTGAKMSPFCVPSAPSLPCAPRTVFVPAAVPALAVGGSGDVLSGITAALIAPLMEQGSDVFTAAELAVILHLQAGKIVSRQYPERGNLASDIANAVADAKKELADVVRS